MRTSNAAAGQAMHDTLTHAQADKRCTAQSGLCEADVAILVHINLNEKKMVRIEAIVTARSFKGDR